MQHKQRGNQSEIGLGSFVVHDRHGLNFSHGIYHPILGTIVPIEQNQNNKTRKQGGPHEEDAQRTLHGSSRE
jgi:hypothetical protein